ncbi:MAG: DUF362 domain-containing protein [Myxococcales bacterium]|nr:DUF362 domain-containing protein [Myxococcales bacterium]
MSPNNAIPVGLARIDPTYAGLKPPYGPGKALPELADLLGDAGAEEPFNHVYAAVRAALWSLGLDAENFESADWNPLGALTPRGSRIVLKPNFIRHWNPKADTRSAHANIESVITHGAVLRAMADYAFLAVGVEGSVTIAEAPQHDCDFQKIREIAGLDDLVRFYDEKIGRELEVIDLRRESVRYQDGVITERHPLPGDPRGYRMIDLGRNSAFEGSGLDPRRFRGADYDPGPTTEHHRGGRNEYLLSETVLSADLVVNLPKLKTHKKTGVTLAIKNLVGINGDKNLLPHHCVGPIDQGGDEYPGSSWFDAAHSRGTEVGRALLKRQMGAKIIGWARRVEEAVRGKDFIRSGNWHGNRTTWRMCVDLNRCLYYSNAKGENFEAPEPIRKVLTVMDAIIAGEGDGPLAPTNVPLGSVIAATDPIALDLVALRLMGFDEQNIPKIREPMADERLRITRVNKPEDVVVYEVDARNHDVKRRSLNEIRCEHVFLAHPGWIGHIERKSA